MGLTVWIFDKNRRMRKAARQVIELIHSEADGGMTAELPAWYRVHAGEYIGLKCADGRFRLFEVTQADRLDETGTAEITGRDAAWAELSQTIAESAAIKNKTAKAAMTALLSGTGWSIGAATGSGTVGAVADASFEDVESVMQRIADTAKVELVPYFLFSGEEITGKKIDILPQEPTYRGRIISAKNAAEIILTEENAPMTRVYPLGAFVAGEATNKKPLTIADAVWRTSAGKPANKPRGQNWVQVPGTEGLPVRAYVYTDNAESDPEKLLKAAWDDLQTKKQPEASGTARAADLSYLPGYEHTAVRVNDQVAIQTRDGEKMLERVANVMRYYVRKDQTRLEFGKRASKDWITKKLKETTAAARRAGGGAAKVQAEAEDLGAELYRAAESIVELETELATQLNEVWIDLDAVNARIDLKANSSTVSALGERVTGAEVAIDGLNAEVLLRAKIKDVDNLETAVYLRISALDNEIELKADKITLDGYVTASQLSTTNAKISNLTSGLTTATALKATALTGTNATVSDTLTAGTGRFTGLYFGGHLCQRRSVTVTTPSGTATLYYVGYVA